MEGAWDMIKNYEEKTKNNDFFNSQRRQQLKSWFFKSIDDLLHRSLFESADLKNTLKKLETQVLE